MWPGGYVDHGFHATIKQLLLKQYTTLLVGWGSELFPILFDSGITVDEWLKGKECS